MGIFCFSGSLPLCFAIVFVLFYVCLANKLSLSLSLPLSGSFFSERVFAGVWGQSLRTECVELMMLREGILSVPGVPLTAEDYCVDWSPDDLNFDPA